MKRTLLKKLTPTAQVKELMLECLADGKVHSRKEIIAYIKDACEEMEIPQYTEGNISGGIFQATKAESCEKVASAAYRLKKDLYTANFSQTVIDAICDFENKLVSLLRSVDIVDLSDLDTERIVTLKKLISDLKSWKERFI